MKKTNPLGDEHIHSFIRYRKVAKPTLHYKETVYFKCSHPRCMSSFEREQLIGKESLCPQCLTNVFILDHRALERATPKCLACRKTKEAKAFRTAQTIAEHIFKDLEIENL